MLPMSVFVLLPLAWLACSGAARAGASLEVDDAAITPEGRCQVESWLRRERGALQATTVPACGVHGSEIGLGLSARRPADGAVDVALGLKRVLRPLGEGRGWGLAIAAGASQAAGQARGWSLVLPASLALDPAQRTLLHLNAGWDAPPGAAAAALAGIGLEQWLDRRWTLLAEARADRRGERVGQLGLRLALGEAASLDLLAGRTRGHAAAGDWLTLGLNVLLPQ